MKISMKIAIPKNRNKLFDCLLSYDISYFCSFEYFGRDIVVVNYFFSKDYKFNIINNILKKKSIYKIDGIYYKFSFLDSNSPFTPLSNTYILAMEVL